MSVLKVRDTLAATESFTLYDPDDLTVSAAKKIHLIDPLGAEKVVPLELASVASQRTAGSRLYYHDGTDKYRACTTKWNIVTENDQDGWFDFDDVPGVTSNEWKISIDGSTVYPMEEFGGAAKNITFPKPEAASRFLYSGVYDFLQTNFFLYMQNIKDSTADVSLRLMFRDNVDVGLGYVVWQETKTSIAAGATVSFSGDALLCTGSPSAIIKKDRGTPCYLFFQTHNSLDSAWDWKLSYLYAQRNYIRVRIASAIS